MTNTTASLLWITEILVNLNIPFQISGGLAAKIYGSKRELADIDIDIPEAKFDLIKEKVSKFIIYGPLQLKTDSWDLLLMTLNHDGQEIDLCGAYETKIFDSKSQQWIKIPTDFSKSAQAKIYGIQMPIISRDELLAYKKILARPVDLIDIKEIEIFK